MANVDTAVEVADRTPEGQGYSVSAPQVFTRDQVIALAAGVTFTR